MSFTLEFEVEVEELRRTFTVEATCERGEPTVINHMNPELASPGSGPSIQSCRVYDETGQEIEDVMLKDVYIASIREELEWVDGKPQYKGGPKMTGLHPYAGYGRTYMKNDKDQVILLTSLERLIDQAADAYLEQEGEPDDE